MSARLPSPIIPMAKSDKAGCWLRFILAYSCAYVNGYSDICIPRCQFSRNAGARARSQAVDIFPRQGGTLHAYAQQAHGCGDLRSRRVAKSQDESLARTAADVRRGQTREPQFSLNCLPPDLRVP